MVCGQTRFSLERYNPQLVITGDPIYEPGRGHVLDRTDLGENDLQDAIDKWLAFARPANVKEWHNFYHELDTGPFGLRVQSGGVDLTKNTRIDLHGKQVEGTDSNTLLGLRHYKNDGIYAGQVDQDNKIKDIAHIALPGLRQ